MRLSKILHFVLEKSVVLEVVLYQFTEDLIPTNTSLEKPLIICPSPIVADGLRRLMSETSDIMTISKWVNDYLKTKNIKKINKSELMLRLSSIWHHYFPEDEAYLFFKSFELFTELRSFSLNLELLSEFLKELDEKTAKSILIFWTFLQNEQIVDEHLSYNIISELETEKSIWLMGFKHLSGIQIDMVKRLSEKNTIRIFFPENVYAESLNTDWIRWLLPEKVTTNKANEKNLKMIYFSKNKLNMALASLKKMVPVFDITLTSSNQNYNIRQEVVSENLFFKTPEDLFEIEREKLFDSLEEELQSDSVEVENFLLKIKAEKERALSVENFICYKTLSLLEEIVDVYREFQARIDVFSIKVFRIIVGLNSPRVFLTTLNKEYSSRLFELSEVPYRKTSSPLVVIASSNYGTLKSQEDRYSGKMLEQLRSIGPIKRAGLDFLFIKNDLLQELTKETSILLIEEELDVEDLSWREILKNFKLEVLDAGTDHLLKIKKDYLSSLINSGPRQTKKLSASKLQIYLDCPRKYYFSYIAKLDHRPDERLKIAADEMGVIEHEVIKQYFLGKIVDSSLGFDSEKHLKECQNVFDKFIRDHKIILSEKEKYRSFYELHHFSQNGIQFLIDFCLENQAVAIEFEYSLRQNSWDLVGAIDCVIQLANNKIAVFDFKRSETAIGSKFETMNFEKIQIWIYLLTVLRSEGRDVTHWGYLNLSEVGRSHIYDEMQVGVLSKEKIDDFQNAIEKLITNLKGETFFNPIPRISKVCEYCEVQLFCLKGSCA